MCHLQDRISHSSSFTVWPRVHCLLEVMDMFSRLVVILWGYSCLVIQLCPNWGLVKCQVADSFHTTCLFFIAGGLAVQERSPGASLILSGPGIQVHFFPPESEPILMEYINNLNGIADFSPWWEISSSLILPLWTHTASGSGLEHEARSRSRSHSFTFIQAAKYPCLAMPL